MKYSNWKSWILFTKLVIVAVLIASCGSPQYMKMNPPSDSDKDPNLACQANVSHLDNSCWMHTAANMLAGAGYGNGTTVQARADDIFADMAVQWHACDSLNGGWIDTALQWWIGSVNNTWANNPYTVVTVYGNKNPRYPWSNANGAMEIANTLRACNLVGLSISWPVDGSTIGSGGHAITAWGDTATSRQTLTSNPLGVRVTDSDTDTGGDVQVYTYDAYNNPNPSGANEGDGWYFDYSANHPYIKHIVTLTPTQGILHPNAVRVIGSFQIQQNFMKVATDLHYQASTDTNVLTYFTTVNRPGTPTISEADPRRGITVDYVFEKAVPTGEWVTITTEFVEPAYNAIRYHDVYFTYPDTKPSEVFSEIKWAIDTPAIDNAEQIPNVTGGYVIGTFDIFDQNNPEQPMVHYRLVHQYLYNQSPEYHIFTLTGQQGFIATNFRFTHSYGYPSIDELWQIEKQWLTEIGERYSLSEKPVEIIIDWTGLLPYPEGDR